ncbi:MAG: glycosyltransferase family 2 protein [Planctomycetes bacterium]|nr:glycosyltransferase family 2 protein [Planctomycetota bacterium]
MTQKLSVIIPAYNEEGAIAGVLKELGDMLQAAGIDAEIIVVDDGSRDATAREARRAGARVLRHRSNRGYGAALKTGIPVAKNDIVAIADADGTYPTGRLPEMLAALDDADMVVGSRTGENVNIPLVRRPAKWLLNMLANYISSARIPDLNSGLRVFRRDVVMQYFPILPNQFSWTTTITLALHCDQYAVTYIPIDYRKRKGRSKIVPWDAGSFAILILRAAMLFRPLRVFIPLVFATFAAGVVKMLRDFFVGDKMISASAILMFFSALLILLIGMVGDAMATRLGRLNTNAVAGVSTKEFTEDAPESEPPAAD